MPAVDSENRSTRSFILRLTLIAVLGSGVGLTAGSFLKTPEDEITKALPDHGVLPDFELTERSEKTISLEDLHGYIWIADFIFTSCAGVCPMMTAHMAKLQADLPIKKGIKLVSISVDPERDTPEVLNSYVSHFHPRLIGLTGTPAEIEAATRAYGVFFERSENSDGGEIQHTSNTFLIGPDGQALSIFRHNTPPEEMAAVILEKLRQSQDQNAPALP